VWDGIDVGPRVLPGSGALSPKVGRMSAPSVPRVADLEVVRDSYDRVADNYVHMVATTGLGDLRAQPWLRAALDVFADAVDGLGPVLDVGCGPGTVTAYLGERGLDVSGVDLSPRMIEHARRLHPGGSFRVGSATDLELAESSLGGVLGWWSLFNLPRDVLPHVLNAFSRALVPGGQVIIATHVGDGDFLRTEAYGGVPVRWTTHKWRPEQLASLVERAGLRPLAELRLPPDGQTGPAVVLVGQRDG
jgi:SAM-dependent methyltransferase